MVTKRTLYSWVLENNLRWQILLVLMVLLTVGARVIPLEMQKRIINNAIGRGQENLLVLYCVIFISSVLLASLLKFGINILQALIGQQTLKRMREQLFAHIIQLPLPFFRTIQPGQVINSLVNELATVSGFIGSAVSVPLINICTLSAMGGYLFYLNPLLAGLGFVLYPIQLFLVPKLQQKSNQANRARVKVSGHFSGSIGEVLTGIHEVHGHAGYDMENDKFAVWAKELHKANVRMNAYRYGIKFVNNLFENIGPFILFLVGGTMTIRGYFDLGALVAFLSAYASLNEPWRELMDFYQLWEDSRVRYNSVVAAIDRPVEHLQLPFDRAMHRLNGEIKVLDMTYVSEEGSKLLDKVSLHIKPGEMVAIVGFSGGGKSTLVQIIAQLLPYTEGSVRIDGREVKELTKVDIAENVGVVPQHPFIFSGTVRDNLLYSSKAALRNGSSSAVLPDLDQTIEVVQQVGLFVDTLKFGLGAIVAPEKYPILIERLLAARRAFRQRFETEHRNDIEFFDSEKFLEYGSIAQNIIFGDFLDRRVAFDNAYLNKNFCTFLAESEVLEILIELGAAIVAATVPSLRFAVKTEEIFADSPIEKDDFEEYINIVDAISRSGIENLKPSAKTYLLKAALRFVPGRDKMVALSPEHKVRLLAARKDFQHFIHVKGKAVLQFYDPDQYIQSRSIRDNILYGQLKSNKGDITEHIDEHLLQLLIEEGVLEPIVDCGLDFSVGSMGEHLSGGQRQKIALARVFLRRPAIYILDEATAALDNTSQARVHNYLCLLQGKHTILSVVHRLDTLASYDRVVVVKAGKIVENGPYDQLMATKGALYELVGKT